ncbi:uncharacterized protein STEHIDRAFT_46250 [Stereum hirsutum FP-91666 SS1]|uniref:uncharacterized protein n=1 Tax=Stereum hirsutum (strain FP-91666) TaxID=721885 RepID=UPI000440AFF6|nr:uncharacterized protein STEHIDRAFT_46250 [Stereum hirsutum FP-91666 SS1]EIM91992.1 hypothetical protein STEHIDRAFT_46250 [Stereum hirsutum FP-91666 SS1]
MPRAYRALPPPSRLSQVMQFLNKEPKPLLSTLSSIQLKLAVRNDHWGARHFLKEDMPRIQYTNPNIKIKVNRLKKTKEENWDPELELHFRDGKEQKLSLADKRSSDIFVELMNLAGGIQWDRWKQQRTSANLPLVDPPTPKAPSLASLSTKPITGKKKQSTEKKEPEVVPDMPDLSKTGAAMVLP